MSPGEVGRDIAEFVEQATPPPTLSNGRAAGAWFAAVLTVATLLVLPWFLRQSVLDGIAFQQEHQRLQQLHGRVTHLDEVLTMSVRLYAQTGDAAWRERYDNHLTPFQNALRDLAREAPDTLRPHARHAMDMSVDLLAVEAEALALVDEGRRGAAVELLSGERYDANRRRFIEGVIESQAALERRADRIITRRHWRVYAGVAAVSVGLPAVIITWALAAGAVRSQRERWMVAEDKLRQVAQTDELTGLPNRVCLNDRLSEAIVRSQSDPRYLFAVLFLDLDRFKLINDTLGHSAGDALLKAAGERIRVSATAEGKLARHALGRCTAARLGGDEFVVLLENVGPRFDPIRAAQDLHDTLRQPYIINDQEVHVMPSVGIAVSNAGHTRAADVLRDADTAMFYAKSKGQAGFAVFDQAMHDEVATRMRLENLLRRAIDRRELVLHYQPIMDLETGLLQGFEALVRWVRPQQGMIPPAQFLPIAEETGLIVPIGEWVIRESCRQLRQWRQLVPTQRNLYVSVNLSWKQLTQVGLCDAVKAALEESKLDPQALALEIAEGVVVRDMDVAAAAMQRLKALGVKVVMDNFGTGYSSLSCLHLFPLDTIKVDRAFIRSMMESTAEYGVIVQAIVDLAHHLKMKVTAEGIETVEQLVQLQALSCDAGQGYHFSGPLPVREAETYLLRKPTLALSA